MPAPAVCLRQENAIDVKRRHLAMRVAHENQIYSRHLPGNRHRLVLIWHLSRIYLACAQVFRKTHVHGNHYHVRSLFLAQNLNPLPGFAYRFAKLQTSVIRRIFPIGNTRCGETENSDTHTQNFLNYVRLVMSLVASGFVSVRGQPGKLRFAARLFQHFQTKVVFMISNRHCVVMQRIHHKHHWVRGQIVFPVVVVLEWSSLNCVA